MSTFFLMIVQLLADSGVPMMDHIERQLSDTAGPITSAPSHGAASQARAAASWEWQKRPREIVLSPNGISNGF